MLLVFVSNVIKAQIATVSNQENGEKIDGVSFISTNPNLFAESNQDGEIDISKFKESESIEIRRIGFQTLFTSYNSLSNNNFNVFLIPSSINLDGVVISASRWEQKSSDIPSKIVSISAEDVQLQNPQTAADLLNASGAVFVQKSQQGGGSPMIRGFATNRLLYTVDGVRMNTAIFRGGNIQNVISLDPFAIENTEVFFGSGSTIYGSDAIGGVMSFKTKEARLSLNDEPYISGNATTRYSSANQEKTMHFDVNVGLKKWAFLSSISHNNFGDLRMGSHGPDEYLRPVYVQRIDSVDKVVSNDDPQIQKPSGYTQYNLMQKVRFQPNENWDMEYAFHYSETSPYARYDRHIRLKNGLPRYGEWRYGPQKWMMNQISINHSSSSKLYDNLSVRFAQQKFEESRISRDINSDTRERRIEEVVAYSINADFTKKINAKNKLFYGLEGVLNEVESSGFDDDIAVNSTSKAATRYPQSNWHSFGVYLNNQHKFSDKTTLQSGVRLNNYGLRADFDTSFYPLPFTEAELSKTSLTGNLGLVYKPNNSWILSTNASTAFRAPNVDDVGKIFDSEPGAVVVPNQNLKAEYAYNFDVGITKMFTNKLKLDVNAFYTLLDNALVRRNFTLNGQDSIVYSGELSQVQAIQNAAVANVYGVQAGLEIILAKGLKLSSVANFQVGEEELDDGTVNPSRHAAPFFGVARLQYRTEKLNLELNSQYSAKRDFEDLPISEQGKGFMYAIDENGNPHSPGWYTVNFKANYQLNETFRIGAGIENILDKRYRPYSSGLVAPGRNLMMSLSVKF